MKKIMRSCGHQEKVWLLDSEVNDPKAIKNHEAEICNKCYLILNRVREVEMDYKSYKIEYHNCRTKPGSYNKESKRIVVYVPFDMP